MIRLTRDRDAGVVSRGFVGANQTKKSRELVKMYFADPVGSLKFTSSHSGKWKKAKDQLKAESHGKCAYCEASTNTVAHGDVEHFRPKSKYWWLAFCYDNYLYSCQICNQSFKSNSFPVRDEAARLMGPAMPAAAPVDADLDALVSLFELAPREIADDDLRALWDVEEADLPNPYLEDPEKLFIYEEDNVNSEIWVRSAGADRADRAMAAAEEFYGLNREELRRARHAEYQLLEAFKELAGVPDPDAATLALIAQAVNGMQQPHRQFAGMARFFARQWNLPGALPAPA